MPAGVAALARLGLPDAGGGAPFHGVRYHTGSRVAVGRFPPSVAGASGRGVRRLDLDRALFEAAASTPGVEAHAGVTVEGPVQEGSRVVGVQIDGTTQRAPLVVAADGAQSRFRHRLGLNVPVSHARVGARRHFRLASGRAAPPWVDIYLGDAHEFYVTPLPRGEVLVALLADGQTLPRPIDHAFDRWRQHPLTLRDLLDGAEPVSTLRATSLGAAASEGSIPGVVLLGDAAGFLDPITGGGIAQALMTAERLAAYIVARGSRGAEAWLPDFERDRRVLLRDYRRLTQAVLALARRPRLARAALAALSWTPDVFSHLVGVSGGTRSLLPRRSLPSL
jgi:flavin-dependent dehydrogenase